jgi:hypothetical protein
MSRHHSSRNPFGGGGGGGPRHGGPSRNPFGAGLGFNDGDFDNGPEQEDEDRTGKFMSEHTEFLGHADTNEPPNSKCPICLEGITEHLCLKIVNVPGCRHLIGMKCLEEMLKRSPDNKKECPLCRAEWIPEAGIWQDSPAFAALAHGGGGRSRVPGGRTGGGRSTHGHGGQSSRAPGGAQPSGQGYPEDDETGPRPGESRAAYNARIGRELVELEAEYQRFLERHGARPGPGSGSYGPPSSGSRYGPLSSSGSRYGPPSSSGYGPSSRQPSYGGGGSRMPSSNYAPSSSRGGGDRDRLQEIKELQDRVNRALGGGGRSSRPSSSGMGMGPPQQQYMPSGGSRGGQFMPSGGSRMGPPQQQHFMPSGPRSHGGSPPQQQFMLPGRPSHGGRSGMGGMGGPPPQQSSRSSRGGPPQHLANPAPWGGTSMARQTPPGGGGGSRQF